jgi:hypothetical protein
VVSSNFSFLFLVALQNVILFRIFSTSSLSTRSPYWIIKFRMCAQQHICNKDSSLIKHSKGNLSLIFLIIESFMLQLSTVTI